MVRKLAYALSVTSILGSNPAFAAIPGLIEDIIHQKGVARYSPVIQNPNKKQSKYLGRALKWTGRAQNETSKYGPGARKNAKALRKARKYWNKFLKYGGDVSVLPVADAVPMRRAVSLPVLEVSDNLAPVNKPFVPLLPNLDSLAKEKGEAQEKPPSAKLKGGSENNLRVEDLRGDTQPVIPGKDPISIQAKKVKLTINHNYYYWRPEGEEESVSLRQPVHSIVFPQDHLVVRRDNEPQEPLLPENKEAVQPVIISSRMDSQEERQEQHIERVVDPVVNQEDRGASEDPVHQQEEQPLVLDQVVHDPIGDEGEQVVAQNGVVPVVNREDRGEDENPVYQQEEQPLVLNQVVHHDPIEDKEKPVVEQNGAVLVADPVEGEDFTRQLDGLHLVLRLKAPDPKKDQDTSYSSEDKDSQIFSPELFGYSEDGVDVDGALENLKSLIGDFTGRVSGLRLQSKLEPIDLSSLKDQLRNLEDKADTFGLYDKEGKINELFSEAQLSFSQLKSEVEMFHDNLNREREGKLESLGLALNELSEKIVPVEVEMSDLRDAPRYNEEALKVQREEFGKLKGSVAQIEESLNSLNDQLKDDWTSPSEDVAPQLLRVEQLSELLDEEKARLKLLKNIFKEITKSEVVEGELDTLNLRLLKLCDKTFGKKDSLSENDLGDFEESLKEAEDDVLSLGTLLGEERQEVLADKLQKGQITLARLKSRATLNHENERAEREMKIESLAVAAQDLDQGIAPVEEKLSTFKTYFSPKEDSQKLIQTREELSRLIEARNRLEKRLNSLVVQLEGDKASSSDELVFQREKLESLREILNQKSEELALLQSKSELFKPTEEAMEEDIGPKEANLLPSSIKVQPKVEHQEEKDTSVFSDNNNKATQEEPSEPKVKKDALKEALEPLNDQLTRLSISSVDFLKLPPEKEKAVDAAKWHVRWLKDDLAKIYPDLDIKAAETVEDLKEELLGLRSKLLQASFNSLESSQLETKILNTKVILVKMWANSLAEFMRNVFDNK